MLILVMCSGLSYDRSVRPSISHIRETEDLCANPGMPSLPEGIPVVCDIATERLISDSLFPMMDSHEFFPPEQSPHPAEQDFVTETENVVLVTRILITIGLHQWAFSQSHRHESLGYLGKSDKNGNFYKLLTNKDSVAL